MRIWSLHPCYLDQKGLNAVWNETLIGRAALVTRSGGWFRHRQLDRFRPEVVKDGIGILTHYLEIVYQESVARGYNFDKNLLERPDGGTDAVFPWAVAVTQGQVTHELKLLRGRLKERCPEWLKRWPRKIVLNPVFKMVPGRKADWEKSEE